ncbi:DUF4198 domain-containing protein [bacterium]|nr:DUF4198 domain-containing protein [bacterium]
MLKKLAVFVFFVGMVFPAYAHFGMIIPSTDIVEEKAGSGLTVKVMFAHPFEGNTMDMVKPVQFGVFCRGAKSPLLNTLKPLKVKGYAEKESHRGWTCRYNVRRPGDYIFFCEPKPYWEPAEDCFIVHYTKVIVDAFGMEEGWDEELGLKTEVIPLTRPYGLYTGNVFQGLVKVNGEPAPFTEVEVEYFNEDGKSEAPAGPFVTQVTKCDANGVFTYSMPKAGWWGFAALNEDDKKLVHEGEEKSIEIGAVIWVKVYDMR